MRAEIWRRPLPGLWRGPRQLPESRPDYLKGDSLKSMIEEDLVAERIASESYREVIAYLDKQGPTTYRLLEEILASEEHAEDLSSILQGMKD